MNGGELKHHPLVLLVNYWELRPATIGPRLDELLRQGVRQIATYVPWQALESDIAHLLPRFLSAAVERRMDVSLIVTPELGVHAPQSGIPRDLLRNPENWARTAEGEAYRNVLPPGFFPLPSLQAPEIQKRFQNFLTRVDNALAEAERLNSAGNSRIEAIISGSLFKHYRGRVSSAERRVWGAAEDASAPAMLALRQETERFYSLREFSEVNPLSANWWKSPGLDEVNRLRSSDEAEFQFRTRCRQAIGRKARGTPVREIELVTPEADASLREQTLLSVLSGRRGGGFHALAESIDLSVIRHNARPSDSEEGVIESAPWIAWTGLGLFSGLTDPEKQFLVLKSLLSAGPRGGGVLLDECEWRRFSPGFRARTEAMARAIRHGRLRSHPTVGVLTPSLWSRPAPVSEKTYLRIGTEAQWSSRLESTLGNPELRMLVVDPRWVLTRDRVLSLLRWLKKDSAPGRVLALAKTSLYTPAAREELDLLLHSKKGATLRVDIGFPSAIVPVGQGRLVLGEIPESAYLSARTEGEFDGAYSKWIDAVFSLDAVKPLVSATDRRVHVVTSGLDASAGTGVFVFNASGTKVTADLHFRRPVVIGDLGGALLTGDRPQGRTELEEQASRAGVRPSTRFSLEIPPFGVLPLNVVGLEAVTAVAGTNPPARMTTQPAAPSASGEQPAWN